MRRPFESLEDFTGRSGLRKPPDPPAAKYIEPVGTRRELEPLAVWEGPGKKRFFSANSLFPRSFLDLAQFHRSIAAGAFSLLALIVGTTLYFGNRNPAVEFSDTNDEVATVEEPQLADVTPSPGDQNQNGLTNSDDAIALSDQNQPVKRSIQPRHSQPRVLFARYRTRHVLPQPKFVLSDFIPTTLVIYVENGVVKTRIQPQTAAILAKPRPSMN